MKTPILTLFSRPAERDFHVCAAGAPLRRPLVASLARLAFASAFLSFAGLGWASTGACLNPAGTSVSGCSTVDLTFSSFITPANNNFVSAGVGTNFLYNPTLADQGGSGWTFNSVGTPGGGSGDNGALIYGSQWYATTPPGGPQVAGLQQFSGTTAEASISQEISGFTAGQSYGVEFYTALRNGVTPNNPEPGDKIEVLLGGQLLGTFIPSTETWTSVTTGTMVATSSSMNLEFVSASGGTLSSSEVDTLLDDVLVGEVGVTTPEPATLVLAGAGLALLAGWKKLRSRISRRGTLAAS